MANKKRIAQRQQEVAQQQRQRRLIYIGLGVAAAAAVVGLLALLLWPKSVAPPTTSGGPGTAGSGTCESVVTLADEGRGHLKPGETPTYTNPVPASGTHNPEPLRPGVFGEPQDVTMIIHSLEHGYVVLYYRQGDLPPGQVNELANIAQSDSRKIIVAPYPNLPAKVVLTAWAHTQNCDGVNEQAILSFIAEFRDQGPEQSPF